MAVEFGDKSTASESLLRQGFANSKVAQIGHYSDERIKNKDNAIYAPPNQETVDSIIQVSNITLCVLRGICYVILLICFCRVLTERGP